MEFDSKKVVTITYTNYRGETAQREIMPQKIWFGSNEFHKESQWLLDAFDTSKQAIRSFALKDISTWE